MRKPNEKINVDCIDNKLGYMNFKNKKLEIKSEEIEEQELIESLNEINRSYKNQTSKEGLNMICSYLKENIKIMITSYELDTAKRDNKNLLIHSTVKRPLRSMSYNHIYNLNIKEIVNTIIENKSKKNNQK